MPIPTEPPPHRLLLEKEVERHLQHLLHGGAADGVREPIAGRLQLLHHLLVDVEVDPAHVGRERHDLVTTG
jgi:hypothetical protein